jgi:hypothetical protein
MQNIKAFQKNRLDCCAITYKNTIYNYYPERKYQSLTREFTDFVGVINGYKTTKHITLAALSKTRTVFVRLNAGIVGSNPIRSMDICPRFFCVRVVLRR